MFYIDLCKEDISWNPSTETPRAPRAPSVEAGRWQPGQLAKYLLKQQHTQAEALTLAFFKYDPVCLEFYVFFHKPSLIYFILLFSLSSLFQSNTHIVCGRGGWICCLQYVPHFSDKPHLIRWVECWKDLWQWACLQRNYHRILRPQAVVASPIWVFYLVTWENKALLLTSSFNLYMRIWT